MAFSIADKNEVGIMEVIGKANYEKGAVGLQFRIPGRAMYPLMPTRHVLQLSTIRNETPNG